MFVSTKKIKINMNELICVNVLNWIEVIRVILKAGKSE